MQILKSSFQHTMNFTNQLDKISKKNNSLLSIGLDIDLSKIPGKLRSKKDPLFSFNQFIIDQTHELVCAYKPNIAFYEMYGTYGLESLIKTIEYIPDNIPVILDAKRGDIEHSSSAYAKSIFKIYKADATTVSPYMGYDSISPFMEYKDKGIFVLCLTSNPGSKDFQKSGKPALFKKVARSAKKWNKFNNLGLVAGATNAVQLKEIRQIAGDMPILIPGVGAQKGNLEMAVKYGASKNKNRILINSSRSIIYSDNPNIAAKKLRDEINSFL